MTIHVSNDAAKTAVLDEAHLGHIHGAFGTILRHDTGPRSGWRRKLSTLLAILGPGLIVMVGDNDAGAFGTYTQAGQNHGVSLLWTLLSRPRPLRQPEMVLRLGAVTGVGDARLIFERVGKFWGAFSVIDLFILNGLTIVTEFIGIALGLGYLGLPRELGVVLAAVAVMGAARRRFPAVRTLRARDSSPAALSRAGVHHGASPFGEMAHGMSRRSFRRAAN